MKPRSPLTDFSEIELQSLLGKNKEWTKHLAQAGAPYRKVFYDTFPYREHRFNLYSLLGWLKNRRDAYIRKAEKQDNNKKQGAFLAAAAKIQKNITKIEQIINTYKQTHTMPTTTPTTGKTTTPPKPFRQYPADRRMLTGDSVWTTLFFGRSNGVAETLLNRLATVTKDEDNFGCVLVRFGQETATHSIPVCNLLLIRAVEDIPVLSIISDQFAFYITTKSVHEAIAAFWYGGKTGRLRDDARALAELNLDLLKKENA